MKSVTVKCWKLPPADGVGQPGYITTTGGFGGYQLVLCNHCGKLYAADILDQAYRARDDLDGFLESVECADCGQMLSGNWSYYPDTYLDSDGELQRYDRSWVEPRDEDSFLVEFSDLFSLVEPYGQTEYEKEFERGRVRGIGIYVLLVFLIGLTVFLWALS
ncbi:hypothetical protein OAU50_03335 [Planctomycetota bacterium]|nr:hypothetical protein [Planctomycetota bacterium]